MYRLLEMRFADDSIDEAIRMGLLAFCYHTFLQWQDVRLPQLHFSVAYRKCVLHLELAENVPVELVLWLLMIGAISIYDLSEDPLLRQYFQRFVEKCNIRSWRRMQDSMKSFMWIAFLDEDAGKFIYNLLLDRRMGKQQC